MGKYSAVLRRHGKRGFGVPSKAPDVGSFPLYPLKRARYALTIIAAPNYDSKKKLRASIAKRALVAHPSLKSYWNQLNRETIKPRLSKSTSTRRRAANPRRKTMPRRRRNYGSLKLLENPYGMSLGKGKAIRVGKGERTHVLDPSTGAALCGAGEKTGDVRPSDAKVITCYRCIKILNMQAANTVKRKLKYGKRTDHYMIPGGREGRFVSGVDTGMSLSNAEFESLMGDENYPTQSLGMIEHIREERTGSKRRKAARRKTTRRIVADDGVVLGELTVRKRRKASRGKTKVISMPGGGKRYMVDGKFASKAQYDSARKGTARKGSLTRRRKKMGAAMIANPRSYKMGYSKGVKDYRSSSPSPASQIRSKSMDYQVGYLEGYSDSASKRRPAKSNPKRRRRNGAHGDTKKGRMSNGRMWYMVDGKFTTKAKYDRKKRR